VDALRAAQAAGKAAPHQPTNFFLFFDSQPEGATTNPFFSHPVGAESRAHGVFLSLLLQPLGHQVPFIFLETGGAI